MALIQLMPSRIVIDIPALDRLVTFLEKSAQAENQQAEIDALTATVRQLNQRLQTSEKSLEGAIKENE